MGMCPFILSKNHWRLLKEHQIKQIECITFMHIHIYLLCKYLANSHEDIENDDDAAMSTLSTVHHPNSGFCIMIPNFRVGPVIVLGLISVSVLQWSFEDFCPKIYLRFIFRCQRIFEASKIFGQRLQRFFGKV